MINLDFEAQRHSQEILKLVDNNIRAKDIENLVTKTMGVLEQNGIYACIVYLLSRPEEKIKDCLIEHLLELTKFFGLNPPLNYSNDKELLDFISRKICNDLDTIILIKSIWEQTLLYSRFNAKALGKDNVESIRN